MDLSPEERARIYAEEKARLEVREELERNRPPGVGRTVAILLLVCFLAVIVVGFVNAVTETDDDRAKRQADDCMKSWQLKFAEKGYSYDDGRLGAVMQCSAEIDRVPKSEGGR